VDAAGLYAAGGGVTTVCAAGAATGGGGGEADCDTGGVVVTGATASRSSSLRPNLRLTPDIDTEAHDVERQYRDDSMCTRWPPTVNEIEPPACADELSAISTARKQNRFIGASAGDAGKIRRRKVFRM
jgi:hypothetical protein